jgi:hypothetical protein
VQQAAFRCSFLAHHGGLSSPHGGPVTLLALPQALHAGNLARLSGPFTLVSQSFPPIGCLLARVGFAVSLIGDPVAVVCHSLARDQPQPSRTYLCLAHLDLNLALLDLGLAIHEDPISLEGVFTPAGRSLRHRESAVPASLLV